jgi:hypothetical protein
MYFNRKTADGFPIDDTGFFVIIKSDRNLSPQVDNYQFAIDYEFLTPDEMIDMAEYIEQHSTSEWIIGVNRSLFNNPNDAMIFSLRCNR